MFITAYASLWSLKVLTQSDEWLVLLIFNGLYISNAFKNNLLNIVLFWWATLYVNGHLIKSALSKALLEFDHIVGGFIAAKSPGTRRLVIYFIITRYTSKIVYFPEAGFSFRFFFLPCNFGNINTHKLFPHLLFWKPIGLHAQISKASAPSS